MSLTLAYCWEVCPLSECTLSVLKWGYLTSNALLIIENWSPKWDNTLSLCLVPIVASFIYFGELLKVLQPPPLWSLCDWSQLCWSNFHFSFSHFGELGRCFDYRGNVVSSVNNYVTHQCRRIGNVSWKDVPWLLCPSKPSIKDTLKSTNPPTKESIQL